MKSRPFGCISSSYKGKTGVYVILNTRNGKIYVGSSSRCLAARTDQHLYDLRANRHCNEHLQRSYNKHGSKAFKVLVVECYSATLCILREQFWIDYYQSWDWTKGYNKSPTAGSALGVKHSNETKAKVAAAGRNISDETRAKRSAALTGRKVSPEHHAKIVALNRAKAADPEFRKRLSKSKIGTKISEEHKAAISRANRNRPVSEETRLKLSRAAKGRVLTEIHRHRIGEAGRGKKRSPESIARMKAAWVLRKAARGLT